MLRDLIRFQEELPPSWRMDSAWDLPEPERSPIPEELARATFDMREVLASWADAAVG